MPVSGALFCYETCLQTPVKVAAAGRGRAAFLCTAAACRGWWQVPFLWQAQPPERGFLRRQRCEVQSEIAASKEELSGISNAGSRRCQPTPSLPQKTQQPWMAARRGSNPGQSCFSPHSCEPGADTSSRCLKQPFHYVYI